MVKVSFIKVQRVDFYSVTSSDIVYSSDMSLAIAGLNFILRYFWNILFGSRKLLRQNKLGDFLKIM